MIASENAPKFTERERKLALIFSLKILQFLIELVYEIKLFLRFSLFLLTEHKTSKKIMSKIINNRWRCIHIDRILAVLNATLRSFDEVYQTCKLQGLFETMILFNIWSIWNSNILKIFESKSVR